MKISFVPSYSSHIKIRNKVDSKVSFGEYDGDWGSDYTSRMSRDTYNTKEEQINEKYDKMRSSWLSDCDDLDISASATWDRLKEIERMRENELADLESEYNRC